MGLPVDDWSRVHEFFGFALSAPEVMMRAALPDESYSELRPRKSTELFQYCQEIVDRDRLASSSSLMSRVTNGVVDGCPLTDQQLNGYTVLLLAAGNETTRNATTGGVIALPQTPGGTEAAVLRSLARRNCRRGDLAVDVTRPELQFARIATTDLEMHRKRIARAIPRCVLSLGQPRRARVRGSLSFRCGAHAELSPGLRLRRALPDSNSSASQPASGTCT